MNTFIRHAAYQYQVWRCDNNVYGRIAQLYMFILFVHLRCWAAMLFLCLLFSLVCTACASCQTWRLEQMLEHIIIIVIIIIIYYYNICFRPLSTNQPQWIHIPLRFLLWFVFFLYCCFFVAAFILFATFQLGLNIFMSFMCIFLSFHVPCVTSIVSLQSSFSQPFLLVSFPLSWSSPGILLITFACASEASHLCHFSIDVLAFTVFAEQGFASSSTDILNQVSSVFFSLNFHILCGGNSGINFSI